jgi:hypothetical protein
MIQLNSYSRPKTTEQRCPEVTASQLAQTLLVVFQQMCLLEVVGVDVFPPPHTTYLIRNSFANTQNACVTLIAVVVLHRPPCPDLRTKRDLIVHTSNVVENIIG